MGEILIHSKSSVYTSHNVIPLLWRCAGFGNIYFYIFMCCIHSHMVRFLYGCGQERGTIMVSFIHLEEDWLVYIYIYKYSLLPFQNSLLFCIQQWHNTLGALDLCLNLATKLPWDVLYAGRLNPFMAGMEITLLLTTGSLNKWKQEAVRFSFGKGTFFLNWDMATLIAKSLC